MLPRFTLLVCLFVSLCLTNALAQWRVRQRSHQLVEMSTDDLRYLCGFTDMDAFKQLLKPIMVERIVGTPSHQQVGQFIKQAAEQYGFATEWDIFTDNTPYGPKTFRNLIATFDPLVPRRLVLACHYDSKIMPGKKFIAATDSAVPCAMLLDVARILGPIMHQRTNQQITLQLVFLDGEEAFVEWSATDSVYGARHLSELWTNKWYPSTSGSSFELSKEIDRIDVFMLLDLLGAPNPRITSTFGHGTTELFQELPKIEKALKSLNCLKKRPYAFQSGTSFQAVEDDHMPFMAKGVPVMHLISVPFPSVWHTPADNEKALDYDTIENLNAVVRVFVARYLGITPVSGK
uniref:Glutaminyl-peptide cyclotransferase n=1 Tax=Panagrolaimus sp. JU765 TaxID=591449 RepID=A0AC34QRL1_9BILA